MYVKADGSALYTSSISRSRAQPQECRGGGSEPPNFWTDPLTFHTAFWRGGSGTPKGTSDLVVHQSTYIVDAFPIL